MFRPEHIIRRTFHSMYNPSSNMRHQLCGQINVDVILKLEDYIIHDVQFEDYMVAIEFAVKSNLKINDV